MIKKSFFLIITLFSFSFYIVGQNSEQAEGIDVSQIQIVYEDNLDSLLNLWYVQNSEITDELLEEPLMSDSLLSNIPDSVYAARLAALPFAFKMTYNTTVRRYIEMYTQRKRDRVQVMLGLADYYFPKFDEVFDFYGVPNEIKYMSIIESALNPRARSRARAVGIWQFMYGTGKMYGLTMNSLIDERRDPVKETHAAARFSKDLFNIYGDWQLVVAAYNCGPGNVNKAIRRAGGKKDFWEIYRFLPRETRGHVPAFIAAAYLMNYYKEHNLIPVASNLPYYSDTIMVQTELHLGQVSTVLNVPLEQLRDMNPQYLHDIIPARNGLSYPLMLPTELTGRFIDLQDSILAYRRNEFLDPGKLLKSPDYVSRKTASVKNKKGYSAIKYKVKEGDNLGLISSRYKCRVTDIMDWNDLYNSKIRVGQKLIIYVKEKEIKDNNTVKTNTTQNENLSNVPVIEPDGKIIYYTVREGDTLWGIAKKYPGITYQDIKKWNNFSANTSILPGQQIKIKVM